MVEIRIGCSDVQDTRKMHKILQKNNCMYQEMNVPSNCKEDVVFAVTCPSEAIDDILNSLDDPGRFEKIFKPDEISIRPKWQTKKTRKIK